MSECVFCKIVVKEIPSYKVYENDKVMAFLDVLPISPGHTVIVPKSHVLNFEDLSDEVVCSMAVAVKKIGRAMIEGLGVKGYSVTMDNKSAANQRVPHTHFHLVPRAKGDGLKKWPGGYYKEGQAEEAQKKIREKL